MKPHLKNIFNTSYEDYRLVTLFFQWLVPCQEEGFLAMDFTVLLGG